MEKVVIGRATLYCGDCLEVLPALGRVDAIVTDPPYGLGEKHNGGGGGAKSTWKHDPSVAKAFDMERPSKECFDLMLAATSSLVIWGGNYFADLLPPRMGWLVWDKGLNGFSTSDFEMAWTSRNNAARRVLYPCGNERGFAPRSQEDSKFINSHPTQKPVGVMKWCLQFFPDARTIVDPFAGSCSTGVACMDAGLDFIGIELNPRYFDTACERIDRAQQQMKLAL